MWAKKNTTRRRVLRHHLDRVCGTPTDEQREIFDIVSGARDAASSGAGGIRRASDDCRMGSGRGRARAHQRAGYGEYFVHRTGHSIGQDVHGNGANMDNLETKDERESSPSTCFSVEPGIYLPEFGVRSEVNVMIHNSAAQVTGKIQSELVFI